MDQPKLESESVRKLITLPRKMFLGLKIRANKFGMKYTDYLRILIARDIYREVETIDQVIKQHIDDP